MKSKQRELFPKEPATEVMKVVARSVTDEKKLKKAFSPDEIEEILAKRKNLSRFGQNSKSLILGKFAKH